MNDILTWISTVGWSPYAVINPLWAYCKANDEYPDKVILLFTGAGIIKNNFKMCKDSITKILKSFTNNRFKSDKIIGHELKTENFETYAEELRKIIIREKELEPKGIILDMTPGRKYMSALMMIYGMELNCKKVPIDVYYLHLEDDKYLNYPYQMIPVKINNFINIFEYSAIFEELKFESASIKKEEQIFSDVRKIIDDKLWKKLESIEEQKALLFLASIFLENNTKYKIMGLFRSSGLELDDSDFRYFIQIFKASNYLYSDKVFNQSNNRTINIYRLNQQGQERILELMKNIL